MKKAKFQLKNGKEVRIGDSLAMIGKGPFSFNSFIFQVTEENLPKLLESGILKVKPAKEKKPDNDSTVTKVPMDLGYYIKKLAERLDWKESDMFAYLKTTSKIYPMATFSIILRVIAIELDKKYEDHISNSPEIFTISALDGRIHAVRKADIRSYRNFAAFRTIQDAKIACRITRSILKELFRNDRK